MAGRRRQPREFTCASSRECGASAAHAWRRVLHAASQSRAACLLARSARRLGSGIASSGWGCACAGSIGYRQTSGRLNGRYRLKASSGAAHRPASAAGQQQRGSPAGSGVSRWLVLARSFSLSPCASASWHHHAQPGSRADGPTSSFFSGRCYLELPGLRPATSIGPPLTLYVEAVEKSVFRGSSDQASARHGRHDDAQHVIAGVEGWSQRRVRTGRVD